MGVMLIFPIGLIVALCCFVLWIWTLIDCITNEPKDGNEKIVWVIVIVFTHFIGALIYLLVRRPRRIAQYGC